MQSESQEDFDIFLSHNSADKDWVRYLGERLESEGIEAVQDSRKIKVFFDEWDIDYAENIVNRISDGLTRSRFMAVVLSPEFLASGWTNMEWTEWLARNPKQFNLLPILRRDVDLTGLNRIVLPMPFSSRRRFDFRDDKRFEKSFEELVRVLRGQRSARGERHAARFTVSDQIPASNMHSWHPDEKPEIILSNLLRVEELPEMIWSLETSCERRNQVYPLIPDGEREPSFIIKSKRIWTFFPITEDICPLREAGNVKSIKPTPIREWLTDSDKTRWLTMLLNQVLKDRLGAIGIKKDDKGRFYFKANKDGSARTCRTHGDRPREVAGKRLSPDGSASFFVHVAARIKFLRIGDDYYLSFDPTYIFTEDGIAPIGKKAAGKLTIKWAGAQRNDSIIRNVLFWMKVVTESQRTYNLLRDDGKLLISGVPEAATASKGIGWDEIKIGSLFHVHDDADADELDAALAEAEIDNLGFEGDDTDSQTEDDDG